MVCLVPRVSSVGVLMVPEDGVAAKSVPVRKATSASATRRRAEHVMQIPPRRDEFVGNGRRAVAGDANARRKGRSRAPKPFERIVVLLLHCLRRNNSHPELLLGTNILGAGTGPDIGSAESVRARSLRGGGTTRYSACQCVPRIVVI